MKRAIVKSVKYVAAVAAVTAALGYDAAGWSSCTTDTAYPAQPTQSGTCNNHPCQGIISGKCSLPLVVEPWNCALQNQTVTLWQCSGSPCVANQVQVNYQDVTYPACP